MLPSSTGVLGSPTNVFGMPNPRASSARAVPIVEPDMDDEGGVEYVKNLTISGSPIVGSTLTCEGEFIGEPTVQWYRSQGSAKPTTIEGQTMRGYTLTADDAGCAVRVRARGIFAA